jgi:PST family polysaccharide transporter
VPLFRVLAPAAFVETFNTVGSWCCIPRGQSGRLIRWQVFATTTMVAAFMIGARWGAFGMAAAVSISTVALRLPAIIYLVRGSPVSPTDVLKALYPPAGASIAAGAVLFVFCERVLPEQALASLILIGAVVFAAAYVALLWAIPAGRMHLRELSVLLRDLSRGFQRRSADFTDQNDPRILGG